MSAVTLTLLFVGALMALWLIARRLEQRPPTTSEVVIRITANMDAFNRALGERLIPVLQEATLAFLDFDEAFRRIQSDIDSDPGQATLP